jgi:two-component system phosphate regulon response regulator PhoB
MSEAVQVLVVEDEDDIRNLICLNLRRAGFDPLPAPTGEEALELAAAHQPPVVLLDVMLPGISGTVVCARLRADPATRGAFVILLTARGEEDDRIAGFEAGADDYVTKPFSPRELVLRVQAATRRIGGGGAAAAPPGQVVHHGRVRIDPSAHRAWVDDAELELTATEYRLLVYLSSHPGKLCERGELLVEVWDLPASLNTRTVDTHIKRLRQKLGDSANYVETVRGAGYRFQVTDP